MIVALIKVTSHQKSETHRLETIYEYEFVGLFTNERANEEIERRSTDEPSVTYEIWRS